MNAFEPVGSALSTPWQSNHASSAGKADSMFTAARRKIIARENIENNCHGTAYVVNVVFTDGFM